MAIINERSCCLSNAGRAVVSAVAAALCGFNFGSFCSVDINELGIEQVQACTR